MGDGRDVGRKYVGGIGCGSGCRLGSRGAVVGEAGMCRVVFLFCFCLWGVILLSCMWFVFACSLVVDWFCLFFFFDVTLVSLFDSVSCV